LKRRGIESIGVFLQSSSNMLVLWDPTYARRLWCVFELAAYVHAHMMEHGTDFSPENIGVHCRPIILGPTSMAMFIAGDIGYMVFLLTQNHETWVPVIFFFIGVVICVAFREFHRTLAVLRSDFMSFQVAAADCFCCSHDHVDPATGKELICDRKVIEGCIEEWWDELEPFEEFVQTRLFGVFESQLGLMGIPYHYLVLAGLPILWAYLDLASPHVREGQVKTTIAVLIRGLAHWLFVYPTVIAIGSSLARSRKSRRMRSWRAVALLAACGGVATMCFLTFVWVSLVKTSRWWGDLKSSCVLFAWTGVVALAIWRPGRSGHSLLDPVRRRTWSSDSSVASRRSTGGGRSRGQSSGSSAESADLSSDDDPSADASVDLEDSDLDARPPVGPALAKPR